MAKLSCQFTRVFSVAAMLLLVDVASFAQGADSKFEATLVWGTNESKPPAGKDYKPIEADIRNKLRDLPLKWTNWFEVRRRSFRVPPSDSREVAVSDKCQLDVKTVGNEAVEVSLIGKGREVVKRKQTLAKGEMLVLGGNAPNSTAWLVILKRTD
ncbi:MAG TPA: hypothetical protein VG146_01550 [Verrucomicrobiae bacterium]|nr:hypothetical protein [Verrucomicrobiae bacterium]